MSSAVVALPQPKDPPLPRQASIGEIANLLGCPVGRIRYVVQTRRIDPVAKIANVHIWDDHAIRRIAAELKRIEQKKLADAANRWD